MRSGQRGPAVFQDQQFRLQLQLKRREVVGVAVVIESIGSEESDNRCVGWFEHGGDAPFRVGSKGQAFADITTDTGEEFRFGIVLTIWPV